MILHFNPTEYRRKGKDMGNLVGTVVGIILAIALLLVSPFITIWAMNTLFSMQIQYSIATYFAALWLTGIIAMKSSGRSKS